jgi:hypothetical protein
MKAVSHLSISGIWTMADLPGWFFSRKVCIDPIRSRQFLERYPSAALTPGNPKDPSGSWDSIHVFETAERGRQAHYKLTSTVMLQLVTKRGSDSESEENSYPGVGAAEKKEFAIKEEWKREGEVGLSGSLTRQVGSDSDHLRLPQTRPTDGTRLANARLVISHPEHGKDD